MLKVALLALFAAELFAGTCLPYGRTVTLRGRLVLIDEHGYRQWTALHVGKPICTFAGAQDPFNVAVDTIRDLQIIGMRQPGLLTLVRRLVGHKAELKGKLVGASTGYHRTPVMLDVDAVEALDDSGRRALEIPEPEPPPAKDIAAYDVLVRAGRRLEKEACEVGSGALLTPADIYAPHAVNGFGDVVWLNCRDGYTLTRPRTTPSDVALCSEGEFRCGFPVPEKGTLTFTMRCVKAK